MNRNFTRNSLVRYLYRETSLEESIQITEVLSNNAELRAEYNAMSISKSNLDEIKLSPSDRSIKNILAYCKNELIEA